MAPINVSHVHVIEDVLQSIAVFFLCCGQWPFQEIPGDLLMMAKISKSIKQKRYHDVAVGK